MSQTTNKDIRVVPTGAALGADIVGIDLAAAIDATTFSKIEDAWHDHLVLRFRGQSLDDDALAGFSRHFGDLDMAPTGRGGTPFDPSRPEISVLSNILVNGVPTGGLGNAELVWHQDMTYNPVPPKASLLYGIEVPPSGGATHFCNLYTAFEALPASLARRIRGLHCKHDATRNSSGALRHGYDESYSNAERPGAVHPMVLRHPATGRLALCVGRRPNAWIVGLSDFESDTLLDDIWGHIDQPVFTWSQEWEVGDLVIWDNRCALHRRDGLDPTTRRLMHRTQVRDVAPPLAGWDEAA